MVKDNNVEWEIEPLENFLSDKNRKISSDSYVFVSCSVLKEIINKIENEIDC